MASNFKSLCRTCLQSSEAMKSLFTHKLQDVIKNEVYTVADIMAMVFTNTQIFQNEELPDQICNTCFKEIMRAYLFKLNCENSQKILKQFQEKENDLKDIITVSCSNNENKNFETENSHITRSESICIKQEDDEEIISNLTDIFTTEPLHFDNIKLEPKSEIIENEIERHKNDMAQKDYPKKPKDSIPIKAVRSHLKKCSKCKKMFRFQSESKCKCPICPAVVRSKDFLSYHVKISHGDEPPPTEEDLQCKVCSRILKSEKKLLPHLEIHGEIQKSSI